MPIKRRLQRTRPPTSDELVRMLHDEWTRPKDSGQPLIVVEGQPGEPAHVYVIWDAWNGLSQTERSEVIMDVVENLAGEHRFADPSLITVAMGLTSEEADRLGLRAA
jgi:hypothetical protein